MPSADTPSEAAILESVIATVRDKARGRTRYVGQGPIWDEVLVAEIARLRAELAASRASRDAEVAALTKDRDLWERLHGAASREYVLAYCESRRQVKRIAKHRRIIRRLLSMRHDTKLKVAGAWEAGVSAAITQCLAAFNRGVEKVDLDTDDVLEMIDEIHGVDIPNPGTDALAERDARVQAAALEEAAKVIEAHQEEWGNKSGFTLKPRLAGNLTAMQFAVAIRSMIPKEIP